MKNSWKDGCLKILSLLKAISWSAWTATDADLDREAGIKRPVGSFRENGDGETYKGIQGKINLPEGKK